MDSSTAIPLYARDGHCTGSAMVDTSDLPLVSAHRWHSHESVPGYLYAAATIGGDLTFLHRLLGGLTKGDPREVDHINGDTLDNRRSNIRVVPHAHNQQNRRLNRNSTSGYRGVWRTSGGRWRADGRVSGKKYSLGSYATPEAAATAASAWRAEHMPFAVER